MKPDYQVNVVAGGRTHTVSTYCSQMPEGYQGTCAQWHKQRVQELVDAYEGGGN